MYSISEEQQTALYTLQSILGYAEGISSIQISDAKSGKGDGIEEFIVEFCYDKTIYFARIPIENHLEIWQDASPIISERLRQHITKELPNSTYTQEKNIHQWHIEKKSFKKMKINVGSKNPNKVEAVREALAKHSVFDGCEVCGVEAASEIAEQPRTIDEILRGARNRARNAFFKCELIFAGDLGVGIESGITPLQAARTGYIGICGCAIYTGKENDFYIGYSSGFEYPTAVIEGILANGWDVDTAFKQAGFTNEPRIGYKNGVIGFLTQDRITRKSLAKEAVDMALVSFLNKGLYKKIKQ